jgi:hypothetical protein
VYYTEQLRHSLVRTLQKVQELGHMGCVNRSTSHHGLILLLLSFDCVDFYLCFKYLKFIQCLLLFFNCINVIIARIVVCECDEQIKTVHKRHRKRTTNVRVYNL